MNNKTAIFYSENNNNVLASKVREVLNKFNFFTVYLNQIDDILLKKLNYIDILVLDYTESTLDKKSKELIKKLNEELYIKRIIVIDIYDEETHVFTGNKVLVDPNQTAMFLIEQFFSPNIYKILLI